MISDVIAYTLIQAARDIIRALIEGRRESIEKIRSDNHTTQVVSLAKADRDSSRN